MLKGTATIELTDVKTGKKEVVKHDNLVTNAIQSALSTPFAFPYKRTSYIADAYEHHILPLCPNLIGGILLYQDAIEEDPNKYYAPASNKLIGYSGNDVSPTEDVMRGSMNQTESGPLEDGSGYRFVFDFATTQGNGTISSVGLTSKWGGVAGFGSIYEENTQSPLLLNRTRQWPRNDNYPTVLTREDAITLDKCVAYDENTETAVSVYVYSQNTIQIEKIFIPTKRWKLSSELNPLADVHRVGSALIETEVFCGTSVTYGVRYYTFCDGRDGYIWGFEHSNNSEGNSSGKASINWIKINTEDYSFEEGTWELDAQLYRVGVKARDYSLFNEYESNNTIVVLEDNNAVISGGYLYCFNYSLTGVYRINLTNVTDIEFIEHPDKKIIIPYRNTQYNYAKRTSISLIGNTVVFLNGYVNVDVIVPTKYINTSPLQNYSTDHLMDGYVATIENNRDYPLGFKSGFAALQCGVFRFFYETRSSGGGYVYFTMCLMSPYLATINNLATPVQKTADKTMKITYILREES